MRVTTVTVRVTTVTVRVTAVTVRVTTVPMDLAVRLMFREVRLQVREGVLESGVAGMHEQERLVAADRVLETREAHARGEVRRSAPVSSWGGRLAGVG